MHYRYEELFCDHFVFKVLSCVEYDCDDFPFLTLVHLAVVL